MVANNFGKRVNSFSKAFLTGKRALYFLIKGDGRQIRAYLGKLGINEELAYPITRIIKFIRRPLRWFKHQVYVFGIKRNPSLNGLMDKETGWGVVPVNTIPGLDKVAEILCDLRNSRGPNSSLEESYIHRIFMPDDLDIFPAVREFVLSDEVIQIVSDYFGSIPVLMSVQGWWTPANSTLEGSQLFHVDNIDKRQAKFFFNMVDIDEEGGPYSFLPADLSRRAIRLIPNWRRRISDEEIFEIISPDKVVSTKGPALLGHVVDGTRCLHYGGRTRSGERLVLMVAFGHVLSPMSASDGITPNPHWYPHDKLRRLILGL